MRGFAISYTLSAAEERGSGGCAGAACAKASGAAAAIARAASNARIMRRCPVARPLREVQRVGAVAARGAGRALERAEARRLVHRDRGGEHRGGLELDAREAAAAREGEGALEQALAEPAAARVLREVHLAQLARSIPVPHHAAAADEAPGLVDHRVELAAPAGVARDRVLEVAVDARGIRGEPVFVEHRTHEMPDRHRILGGGGTDRVAAKAGVRPRRERDGTGEPRDEMARR